MYMESLDLLTFINSPTAKSLCKVLGDSCNVSHEFTAPLVIGSNSCKTCNVLFQTTQEFRTHCKSSEHLYNLKRLSSVLDGQDCHKSSAQEGSIVVKALNDEAAKAWILYNKKYYGFFKSILLPRNSPRSEEVRPGHLLQLLSWPINAIYIVIMVNAGNFAGVVFQGEKPMIHKSFHRYVVRAKQGQAQSTRDSSGGGIHSAGSSLRRANEFHFVQDITSLIGSWKSHLQEAKGIFVHCPFKMLGLFFNKDNGILHDHLAKTHSIPLNLGKPTFSLCQVAAKALLTISVVKSDDFDLYTRNSANAETGSESEPEENFSLSAFHDMTSTSEDENSELSSSSVSSVNPQVDSLVANPLVKSDNWNDNIRNIFDEAYTLCRQGDSGKLEKLLKENENTRYLVLQHELEISKDTLLHIASRWENSQKVIKVLLKLGSNPASKNAYGKTPYDVAVNKANASAFIEFRLGMGNISDINWKDTNIPECFVGEATKSKKKKRHKKDKKVSSQLKQGHEEKDLFLSLNDAEKLEFKGENRCFQCGTIFDPKCSFEYSSFKFCSVPCLRAHRFSKK